MSPRTSSDRIRTRAQRVAARVSYDGFVSKSIRALVADGGLSKVVGILVASLLICVICGVWDPPKKYKLGAVPERPIVSVVDFEAASPDFTNDKRNEARQKTPRYYENDPSKLDDFETEFLAGLAQIVAESDFTQCSTNDIRFLQGFLPKRVGEDAAPRAFDALREYFSNDDDLGTFRETLEIALEPYRANGIVRKLNSDDQEEEGEEDGSKIVGILDNPDRPIARETLDKSRNIKVYDKGSNPENAREILKTVVLIGNGEKIKESLKNRIDRLDVVNFVANKIKNDVPDTLEPNLAATTSAQDRAEMAVQDEPIRKSRNELIAKSNKPLDEYAIRLLNAERDKLLSQRTWRERATRFVAFYAIISLLTLGSFFMFHYNIVAPNDRLRNRSRSPLNFVIFLAHLVFFIAVGRALQVGLQNGAASPEIVPFLIFVQLTTIASTWEIAIAFGVVAAVVLNLCGCGGLDDFIVFTGSGAIVAVLSRAPRSRARFFIVAAVTALSTFSLSFAVELAFERWTTAVDDSALRAAWSFLAGFIAAGALPIFERLYGILTPMRLLEYSNPSHPLLLELNSRAPATYSHSIQTAALAEPAAEAIGANSALARVGAYFHDVGKMLQPERFTENQTDRNVHDDLEPRVSALVIVAHVKDGVDLGRRYKLPRQIVDLIEQHHGSMLAGFFYSKAKEAAKAKNPDAPPLDEAPFRYPGPIPQTKEAAVLMLADAAESASRSLTDWSPRRVENLVRSLAEKRIEDGQFNECGLTLGEIRTVEQSLVSTLLASKHSRIKYPDKGSEKDSDKSKISLKDEAVAKEDKDRKSSSEDSTIVKSPKAKSGSSSSSDSDSVVRRSFSSFEDAQQK
ncbi:MAG: HDIG domain-containing protein [Thermoguttaceae bacterium]|nr:HDIG domain-containing protein [Thermoguttaceae bacterium]